MSRSGTISERLTDLRESLGLSQKVFAENVGITQGALSQLESGKSKLSLLTLTKINGTYGVNCNWLVAGNGERFLGDMDADRNGTKTFKFSDGIIPLVSEEAHAGYIDNHSDPDYIGTLDVYRVPGFEQGNFRLFEIVGDSMVPTLRSRDVVITEKVENIAALAIGFLGVVITNEGIVAKRLYLEEKSKTHLLLKSDNENYKTFAVPIDEVRELWAIKGKITTEFQPLELHSYKKIGDLEMEVQTLKTKLNELIERISPDIQNDNQAPT